jgi:hypothetical protein
MTSVIIIFGLLTFLAGIIIIVNPEIIFRPLENNLERIWLQIIAVSTRLLLGTLLILNAGVSKYPAIIEVLGWLSIGAAVTFCFIGRQRFLSLMRWAFSLLKPYGRVGGLFATLFGGFLIYAFI